MTEIIFKTAIVFVCFVVLVAVGLSIMNGMMDDDGPDHPSTGNAPKPPPEPEH